MPLTELVELEHAWCRAFQSEDRNFLQNLIAVEFRLSFSSDPRAPGVITREAWFSALDRMSFGACELTNVESFDFGNTGVVKMQAKFKDWRIDGTLLAEDYFVTDVFVKRDGCWQVVNRISESVDSTANLLPTE